MMKDNFGSRSWFESTSRDRQQQHQMLSDDDSLAYSASVGTLRSRTVADICSLRALELIRQLSFDIDTPKIVDICDTKAASQEPLVASPPLNQVFVDRDCAGLTSPSFPNGREEYTGDFDDMYSQNRRRFLSEQSPYAVSSASSSTCGDSFDSSLGSGVFSWDDHSCANTSVAAQDQEDILGPPLCTRLNMDTLQKWNALCEQGDNHDMSKDTVSPSSDSPQEHQYNDMVDSYQSVFDSMSRSDQNHRLQMNNMQQEYNEAIQSSMYLSFVTKAAEKKESHSQLATPRNQGKGIFSLSRRQKVSSLFSRKNEEERYPIKNSPAAYKFMAYSETEKNYPLSPDRTVATYLESCCSSGDSNEYFV